MDKYSFLSLGYKLFGKPLFFLFDPELVHDRIGHLGYLLGSTQMTRDITKHLFYYENPKLTQKVAGLTFNNPIGLSAGFDKDAKLISILPSVGFGYMQVGSITDQPYEGNPKPRLYRLRKSKGIVVYYGLKNQGADILIPRIKSALKTKNFPVSISIAKTNADFTATDAAGIKDYASALKKLVNENAGDMYTINISCPNTFGGEPFTTPTKLDNLLNELKKVKTKKPLFIKMPINLAWNQFDGLLKVCIKHKVTGVIIGNLNKDHNHHAIKDTIPPHYKGGISGYPTFALSNELISKTYQKYGNKLIIVGVGGVFSAADAYEKIKRGATLVQLITGMIFEGPQLIGKINKGLVELLERDGYKNISEAVGSYYK